MSIVEEVQRAFADVEVSILGGREERVAAEQALARGDAFRARLEARRLLDRAPKSPVGWALLADACEAAHLDAELEESLDQLSRLIGAAPDVWLRLGRVRARLRAPLSEVREAFTRAIDAAAQRPESADASRSACLELCALELGIGELARAEGLLAGLPQIERDLPEVQHARLAVAVETNDRATVEAILARADLSITDAATQRLLGRAATIVGDASRAVRALSRAVILGDDASVPLLRATLSRGGEIDAQALRAAEAVAQALHLGADPLWGAALATARGDAREAASALLSALDRGVAIEAVDEVAAVVEIAHAARHAELLARVTTVGRSASPIDAAIVETIASLARDDPASAVASLDRLTTLAPDDRASVEGWIASLVAALVARLVPPLDPALNSPRARARTSAWPEVVDRLTAHARSHFDLAAARDLERLVVERERPLRVAIVGEFNAGKSTLLNALLGVDVAPTGILPTTAVAHSLAYGPDPVARARLGNGVVRTVLPERLPTLLAEIGADVASVSIEMPLLHLRRIELIDTPGFNAPDPEHARAALDAVVGEIGVDVAVWLIDGAQPLKASERAILDRLRAHGVAIQLLVNKLDRLSPDDARIVLETVTRDAAALGIASIAPILGFSARRAIAARHADDVAAIEASGLPAVRALLEETLPAMRDRLKESALRRRALGVVDRLVAASAVDEARLAASTSAREASRAASRAIADRLENELRRGDATPLRATIERLLDDSIAAYRRERSQILAHGPDTSRFLRRRLEHHLAQAIARGFAACRDNAPAHVDADWIEARALASGVAAGISEASLIVEPSRSRGVAVRFGSALGLPTNEATSVATSDVPAIERLVELVVESLRRRARNVDAMPADPSPPSRRPVELTAFRDAFGATVARAIDA